MLLRPLILALYLLLSLGSDVFAAPEIRINIPEFTLRLYDGTQLLREYNVALGTPYEPTPTGHYKVFYKEKNPIWTPGDNFTDRTPVPPGPNNPLGSRWIEFKPAYGIHGTNKDWDIEYPVSGGCIRMHNADVQELYDIADIGTPVIIHYETLVFTEKDGFLLLTVLPDIYRLGTNNAQHFQANFSRFTSLYALLPGIKITDPLSPVQNWRIARRAVPASATGKP